MNAKQLTHKMTTPITVATPTMNGTAPSPLSPARVSGPPFRYGNDIRKIFYRIN